MLHLLNRLDWCSRTDMVEVSVPASSKSPIKFDDQPQLRSDQNQDILILAIETYCSFELPVSPTNNPVCSDTQMKNTYLTLYCEGEEKQYFIPLTNLHHIANTENATPANVPYNWDLFRFNFISVEWQKCHLDVPAGLGSNTAFSYVFRVQYLKLPPGTTAKLRAMQEAFYCNLK